MKPFNDCVSEYRKQVEKGDIVIAYRGLMEYMGKLRTHFKNRYPDYFIPGSIYYGYMDMTYFPLVPEKLKNKGLKIAIVLIHDRLRFEAWLAGSNKTIQSKFWEIVKEQKWDKYRIPATIKGQDSIVECDLVDNPDFSDPDKLTRQIEDRAVEFILDIEAFLDRGERDVLYNQLTEEQKNILLLAEEESNDPVNLINYNQQKKKHQK